MRAGIGGSGAAAGREGTCGTAVVATSSAPKLVRSIALIAWVSASGSWPRPTWSMIAAISSSALVGRRTPGRTDGSR